MIKLSILIPSTHKRWDNFNLKIQEQLFSQYDKLTPEQQKEVEILMFVDTKSRMLGQKRNEMVNLALGEYVVHVDSDDRVAPNYITSLLNAIHKHGTDVITFYAEVSISGGKSRICDYSTRHGKDHNTSSRYNRLPNHICCIKKSVSKKSSFPNIMYSEDKVFAEILLPHIKSEHQIKETLYYYDYNPNTSETQEFHPQNVMYEHHDDAVIDIVILSRAATRQLKVMTQTTIDTAIKGANGLSVNVFVIEQVAEVQYDNAKTIYHPTEVFNYNDNMNLGARSGKADNILFCNNDLIFSDAWAHHLLSAKHPLVSPKCPVDGRQRDIAKNEIGSKCGRFFSGWCFMMTRELWRNIGGLTNIVSYWFSDNATIKQCEAVGVSPMLVPASQVRHLGSVTFNSQTTAEEKDDWTWGQCVIYNRHFNDNLFHDNPHYQRYLKRKGYK